MADAVKELVVKVVAQVAGAKDALKSVEKTAKETQKSLKNIEEGAKKTNFGVSNLVSNFKSMASALALVTGALSLFKNAQNSAKEAVDRSNFSKSYGISEKEIKTQEIAYERLGFSAEKARGDIAKIQDSIRNFQAGKGADSITNALLQAMPSSVVESDEVSIQDKLLKLREYYLKRGDINGNEEKFRAKFRSEIEGLDNLAVILSDKNIASTFKQSGLDADAILKSQQATKELNASITELNIKLEKLSSSMAQTLAPAMSSVINALNDSIKRVENYSKGQKDLNSDVDDFGLALRQIFGVLEEKNEALSDFKEEAEGAGKGFTELSEAVSDGVEKLKEIDVLKPIFSTFGTFFSEIARGAKSVWEDFINFFDDSTEKLRKHNAEGYGKKPVELSRTPEEEAAKEAKAPKAVTPKTSTPTKTSKGLATTFDDSFTDLMKAEGGYSNRKSDRGGETKYGIAKKSHPNLDIKNLTLDQAKAIYKKEYWDAIGADSIPEHMRYAVFDAAVNQGQGRAMQWYKQSGGDKEKFLQLRAAAYNDLVSKKPDQIVNLKGWNNRLRSLGYQGSLLARTTSNHGVDINIGQVHVMANDKAQFTQSLTQSAEVANAIRQGKSFDSVGRV